MGMFLKPPCKRINDACVMRGSELVLQDGSHFSGPVVFSAFLRNAGGGGGSGVNIATSGSTEADGQSGDPGDTLTLTSEYSINLVCVSPPTKASPGSVPATFQATGGGYFAHYRGDDGSVGAAVSLNAFTPAAGPAEGGLPGRSEGYTSWPRSVSSVTNPDASDDGRGGFGVWSDYSLVSGGAAAWRNANAFGRVGRVWITIED